MFIKKLVMEKFKMLMEVCPDEVNEFIDKLYNQKFPKKKSKKIIFKFKVFQKEYNSDKFTDNYVEFIKDVSNIHSYGTFKSGVLKSYISNTDEGMKQAHKIKDSFYVTSHSSTPTKIKHILDLCDFLGVTITYLN